MAIAILLHKRFYSLEQEPCGLHVLSREVCSLLQGLLGKTVRTTQ